jgi:glucosylglycerate hydrolase
VGSAPPAHLSPDDRALWDGAVAVLRANDLGAWTKPAPRLYPHQWSWDSTFIAIGLAHIDPDRALRELESLFRAQWADGRVPHMVFDPGVRDYAPGPELWSSAASSDAAPRSPATSGLIQAPTHAIALAAVLAASRALPAVAAAELRERIALLYPKVLAWHRYLVERRDPEGSGLITIYHPWEGTDNTPRWDAPLARVEVRGPLAYSRVDVGLTDASERPTEAEYDRYVWLVGPLRAARYEDGPIQLSHPFLVKDIQCSAVFAAATEVLEGIAADLGAPAAERQAISTWWRRATAAVQRRWESGSRLALDLDLRTGRPIEVPTTAGLSPILVPHLEPRIARETAERMFGPDFAGAPGLVARAVPSTAVSAAQFRPRAYWRGPVWPVVNWLLWWGLRRQGLRREAAALRDANLALLRRSGAAFAEYFQPFTGEPLGSRDQSWTAAVTLDWLASAAER